MMVKQNIWLRLILLGIVFFAMSVFAPIKSYSQIQNYDEKPRGSIYFGIGYQMQFYSNADIKVKQDALNNNYTLKNVTALDNGANVPFSPMQLNFRVGYFFNYNQDEGFELSIDPCKYFVQDGEKAQLHGTVAGVNENNGSLLFSKSAGTYYYLYNGLGKVMFNYVGRFGLYRKESYNFALDIIYKGGLGLMMPKVENSLDGHKNASGLEMAGINFGVEPGLRWISHRHFILDLTYKYNYGILGNLKVYEGTASQNISSGAIILSLGVFLPTTKLNPLFDKGWAHRKRINHTRPMYMIDSQY